MMYSTDVTIALDFTIGYWNIDIHLTDVDLLNIFIFACWLCFIMYKQHQFCIPLMETCYIFTTDVARTVCTRKALKNLLLMLSCLYMRIVEDLLMVMAQVKIFLLEESTNVTIDGEYVYHNPSVPLRFEKLTNNPDKVDEDGDAETIKEMQRFREHNVPYFGIIEKELLILDSISHDESIPPAMRRAHIQVMKAYRLPNPAEAVRKILEDLGENSCAEAYNVLALFDTETYEEAVSFYNEALRGLDHIRITMQTVSHNHNLYAQFWEYYYSRPLMRSFHGIANTLRKMGNFSKAICYYRHFELNNSKFRNLEDIIDWRYHYLEVLMKLGKDKEALDLAQSKDMATCYVTEPTQCSWYWNLALLKYRTGIQRGFEEEFYEVHRCRFTTPLLTAITLSKEVLSFLKGSRKLPAASMPYIYGQDDDLVAAAIYVSSHKSLWDDTPGAVEWAVRNANTFKCLDILAGSPEGKMDTQDTSYATFKKLVHDGIFPEAIVHPHALKIIYKAVRRCPRKLMCFLKAVAEQIPYEKEESLWDEEDEVTALLYAMASEHECHICKKCIKKLGGYPFFRTPNGRDQMPIEVAIVNGNARAVYGILTFSKRLPVDRFDFLLQRLFESDIYDCINSGTKCLECRKQNHIEPSQHSNLANFEACITALLSTGYRPSTETLRNVRQIKPQQRRALMKSLEKQMNISRKDLKYNLRIRYKEFFSTSSRKITRNLKKCVRSVAKTVMTVNKIKKKLTTP